MDPRLKGEEDACMPRQELAKLLLPWLFHFANSDGDNAESEIQRLAKEHPEVFNKNFVINNDDIRNP
eukprot:CAMPEP_0178936142 /NCGR_PEP_ID=MMETSP0786-20121207/25003_1 /TAXON_ID=186022 /ORGANISM="Thalassionema frauenfeldii, Strain CCMP 1798" /LENGTH=66 /DNA_ID=CAMNT_0020614501 /DNA_START=740 /DNA_END=940 /DNA_ORIENTATION=+